MSSFIYILEGHTGYELVKEVYARHIGFTQFQIESYLIDLAIDIDEEGNRVYWKSIIDTTYEMDFIQDELEEFNSFELSFSL